MTRFIGVAFQISDDAADKMTLVLNNAVNVAQYYSARASRSRSRSVAFHGGVDMMRTDKSPVLERLKSVTESLPNLTIEVCNNTLNRHRQAREQAGERNPALCRFEDRAGGAWWN